ncbi:MAG: polyprenyl diphosphate synthase [Candidatus Colwellbacteria bacterium]
MQKSSLPVHVAVILDGNRRWAKAHGKPPWEGHIEGARRVEEVSREAIDLGIKYITFWGGSYNNLTKRTRKEIKFLDERMYRSWAKKALEDSNIKSKGIRIRFIGEWPDLLSEKTQKVMRDVERATRDHSKYHLTYLIGYNGDREMLSAIKGIVGGGSKKISEQTIKSNLWTRELPPVDLVIRTGEDAKNAHISTGFMMWDIKDALLHFSPKMWPAFTKSDFRRVIRDFSGTERRFGK